MYHYLAVGLIIFLIGLFGTIITKNVIKVLISVEIMLTGININFITFGTFCGSPDFDGYIITLFYTGLGAVELAVALFIFYLMYQHKNCENIDKYCDL